MILLGELLEKAIFNTRIILSLPHVFYSITLIYKHIETKFFLLVFLAVSFRKCSIFLFCELNWKMVLILCWHASRQLLSTSKCKAVMSLFNNVIGGDSLVVQCLRIRLPMQGTRVRALAREYPTCRGATKPVHHNYWACALEPSSHNYWAHVPQLLKPAHLEPMLRNKRSHLSERPAHRNEE